MSTFSQGDDTLGPPSSSATSNIALSSGLSHHHQRNFRNPSSASVSQLSPRRLSTVPLQSPHGRFGTHPPNKPSDLLAHLGRSFRPIDWPKMTIHGFPPPPHAAPMNRLVSPGSPPLLPPHGPPRYNTTSYQSVSMPSFPRPPTIPSVDPLQPGMTSTSPDKYDGKTTCRQGRHRTACDRCRKRKNRCDQEEPCSTCLKGRVPYLCAYTTDVGPSCGPDGSSKDLPSRLAKRPKRRDSAEMTLGHSLQAFEASEDAGQESCIAEDRILVEPITGFSYAAVQACTSNGISLVPGLPISSERDNPLVRTISSSPSAARSFWDGEADDDSNISVDAQVSNGYSSIDLMEEDECRNVGSRRHHHGPRPEDAETEKSFFGTSHFGLELAVKVIGEEGANPSMVFKDVRHGPARSMSQIEDTKPYSLVTRVRPLLDLLPSKEKCDRYVISYFQRYNDHIDILYRPDFDHGYNAFWHDAADVTKISRIDLRQFALMLIVIAFGVLLDYDPNAGEERRQFVEDLRLFGRDERRIHVMIEDLEANSLSLKDREELSLKWSFGASLALHHASSFYGESIDTVRAGAMVSLYMIISRRVPEGWTTIRAAIDAAKAQGMHVDGASWERMPSAEAELRRRLWAQLYTIDRSISLFLGRPLAIENNRFTTSEPANITDPELGSLLHLSRPLNHPTKTTFLILHFRLAQIIGDLQLRCFDLHPRTYQDVLDCEAMFEGYWRALPPHFRLEDANTSLDDQTAYRWLKPQRQTLISKFHLARISLHRPYLLRSFGKKADPQYKTSREACLFSSIADITLRTTGTDTDPLDRFKWMTVASGFNPATIIGILCVYGYRDTRFDRHYLLNLLRSYISFEKNTIRRDETLENELRVLEMMVDKAVANKGRAARRDRAPVLTPPNIPQDSVDAAWPNVGGSSMATQAIAPDLLDYPNPFEVPSEWVGTTEAMPESSDMDGWTSILQFLSGVEESPMSELARMSTTDG